MDKYRFGHVILNGAPLTLRVASPEPDKHNPHDNHYGTEQPFPWIGQFGIEPVEKIVLGPITVKWTEPWPEPVPVLLPHRIEELVGKHPGTQCYHYPGSFPVINQDPNGDHCQEKEKRVKIYPAIVERIGHDDIPERFIQEIGNDAANCCSSNGPPIPGEVVDNQSNQYPGQEMGEEIHSITLCSIA